MLAFKLTNPVEIIHLVAQRMKRRRIESGFTQRELAARSGVPYGTLKAFEQTGRASFEAVVNIAFALEAEHEFEMLFPDRPYRTVDDVIEKPLRKRVRHK